MHTGERSGDAGDHNGEVLDAPQEVTGLIEVEHPFGDVDLATGGGAQLEERDGEVQAQRELFGQLVLADVIDRISSV